MKEIIEKFADEYGYILNISEIIVFLRERGLNNEDIISLLKEIKTYNSKIVNNLKEKIKNINSLRDVKNIEPIQKVSAKEKKAEHQNTKNVSKVNIHTYISALSEIESDDDIYNILPKPFEESFDQIINRILLHYIKNEVIILELFKDSPDEDMKELIYEEINENKKMIGLIKKYRDYSLEEEIAEKEINIVFPNDEIFSDFEKSIPRELFKDFLVLLNSIKSDTPKNAKTFKLEENQRMVNEVKNNSARIFFEKLDDITYCIYYAFVKAEEDSVYRDNMINRTNKYALLRDSVLESIKDKDFMERQKLLEQALFNIIFPAKHKEKK